MAPVGAGKAKAVPGAVLVAEAAIIPAGVLPRWQLSQVVDEGMCEPVLAGEVAGMPTRRAIPAKAEGVPLGTWQATQLLVMPAWLIREPLNLAPLGTGSAATEEPVPTWQTSQDSEVGMWLLGNPTTLKFEAGMAKEAAAAPWHCAQLPVVLGALAWMLARLGITV
jgi:hypothetical protein